MNKRILALIISMVIIFLGIPAHIYAEDEKNYDSVIADILEYEMTQTGSTDLKGYVDSGLIPYSGTTPVEWIMIALYQYGAEADYEKYSESLMEYYNTASNLKATDYERIGMALSCLGIEKDTVSHIIDEYTGKLGIMSYIYGLMLINSGDYNTAISKEEIMNDILELQTEDGGWSLTGRQADPDITAMALQALAPLSDMCPQNIEEALNCLSKMQRQSGGYASLGTENAESSCQVLMALCALNIDYESDERFIKEKNIFQAIMEYCQKDGGFSHLMGEDSDAMASSQALLAMVNLKKYNENKSFIYDFHVKPTNSQPISTGSDLTGVKIKYIAFLSIAVVLAAAILIIVILGKKKIIKILIACAVAACGILYISLSKIETVTEHYQSYNNETGDKIEATVRIVGYDREIIPAKTVYIYEKASAFDLLMQCIGENQINIDYSGSVLLGNIYVRSIDGLSEFDYGSMSGWKYTVNGEYPQQSACKYSLETGDIVEWIYVTGEEEQ